MLVIPYFDNDNKCFLWQGRYFPSRIPKVYTSGQPERALLFQKGHSLNGRCVLVEDSISAIKVTRVVTSSPLLGAHLSIHKATLLSRYFNHLTLWLDYDKMSSMVKFCERYKYLFKTIDYICTKKDPKDVPDEQIKELLNG